MARYMTDASLFSALAGRVAEINVQVMEAPLIGIDYMDHVPVNTNYTDWQLEGATAEYRFAGEADWLTGDSDDVPKVHLGASLQKYGFSPYGVGYDFNFEEIGIARDQGVGSITDYKARAARRKSEEFAQKIAIVGDARKNYAGLVNLPSADILPATVAWRTNAALTATMEQIRFDVARLVDGPITTVIDPTFIRADRVAFDQLTYRLLASFVPGDPYGRASALQILREEFVGVDFVMIPELATAATTVTVGGARAIGYARRVDVLELPVAFGYRLEQGYQHGPFKFNVPGWGRLGGVQLHASGGLRYMDGVGPIPA